MGDGSLRTRMQTIIEERRIESVYQVGFKNRKDIGEFYALADMFVLPSHKETWGIVVNEALCFELPIIVSDQVGSAVDLVIPEGNGYTFPAADTLQLTDKIERMMNQTDENLLKMKHRSRDLITQWLNRDLGVLLSEHMDIIHEVRD